MGVTCPDKRLTSWKNLVKIRGLDLSYFLWNEHSGNVPEKYYNSVYNKEVQYQKQTTSNEGIIAAEKTIRDLAARMADRIGMKVKFESDRSKDYKGKIENNTAVINLANATLDTPIHEVLGHPIIRTIKTGKEPNWFPVRSAQLQELYPEIYNFDGKTEEEFSKNFEESEKLAKEQYLKDNPEVR